jgi:hydroxymethylpyrimidine pyrophosphatase-like HAD family hydrolase
MGIWCENPAGEIIEDRYSQITMSALGQQATAEDKYAWAEKYKDIRPVYRDKVAELIPDLEVRIGGTTSTDITLPGVDKAYGMKKLIDAIDISKDEILFLGDKLQEGGNDYPVRAMVARAASAATRRYVVFTDHPYWACNPARDR